MLIRLLKNVFFSVGMAGRIMKGEQFSDWEISQPTHPRFGRYWWFWLPSLPIGNITKMRITKGARK